MHTHIYNISQHITEHEWQIVNTLSVEEAIIHFAQLYRIAPNCYTALHIMRFHFHLQRTYLQIIMLL